MSKGVYKHKTLSPELRKKAIKNIIPFQFKKGHTVIGGFQKGHLINLGKKRKPLTSKHKDKISNSGKGNTTSLESEHLTGKVAFHQYINV